MAKNQKRHNAAAALPLVEYDRHAFQLAAGPYLCWNRDQVQPWTPKLQAQLKRVLMAHHEMLVGSDAELRRALLDDVATFVVPFSLVLERRREPDLDPLLLRLVGKLHTLLKNIEARYEGQMTTLLRVFASIRRRALRDGVLPNYNLRPAGIELDEDRREESGEEEPEEVGSLFDRRGDDSPEGEGE